MSINTSLNVWVYDFEVFKYDWMVTFKNYHNNEYRTFINDRDGLLEFRESNPDMILVGFNNTHYDDWILLGLQYDIPPYKLSKFIVEENGSPYQYPALKYKQKNIISYDLIKDVSLDNIMSLKMVEGYLGLSIYESEVDFNIDRKLTPDEIEETLRYNKYDVDVTQKLLRMFSFKFEAHLSLVERYNMSPYQLSTSGAQKGAIIFNAKPIPKYDTFYYKPPQFIQEYFGGGNDVLNKFREYEYSTKKPNTIKHTERIQGEEYVFGVGGLHMGKENFQYEGEIWNLDVASYYPNLMIHYDYISRACPNGIKSLTEIIQQRLEYKKQGHILNAALKNVIVAIYGNMKYEYSKMWDQEKQTSICLTGQLFLYILAYEIAKHATILQVNTDGIMIIPHNKDGVNDVVKWWESKTKMVLELETGVKLIQKDVNNYIFLKKPVNEIDWNSYESKKTNIKTKGAMLRSWLENPHNMNEDTIIDRVNSNLTILDECLVNYFLLNKPVRQTLIECKQLARFQRIFKLQGKYQMLYMDDERINGKVFRAFFVTDDSGKTPYKCYEKDGELKKEKFANCSPKSVIYLGDVTNMSTDDLNLDYDYYEAQANQMIKLFTDKRAKFNIEE